MYEHFPIWGASPGCPQVYAYGDNNVVPCENVNVKVIAKEVLEPLL